MNNKAQDESKKRWSVVAAALPEVAFDGWNKKIMEQAVTAAGLDDIDGYRLFLGDVANLVAAFRDWTDLRMKEDLARKPFSEWRMTEKVVQSVLARLEVLKPHREAVRHTLAYYTLHPVLAVEHAYKTVDEIWYMAGDKATDFNFYSKRALLAAVYGATLHYWLEDASENFADTEDFLRRRIADVLKIPKLKEKARQTANDMFGFFKRVG